MRTLTGNARLWLVLAGLNGAVAVGLGAYGAHGFDDAPEYLARSFNTGVQYHMWHALALVAVAWLANHTDGWLVRLAGMGFMVGIVLFCGTLYIFGATGNLPLRGPAPVGGISLMAAWVLVALAAWRGR